MSATNILGNRGKTQGTAAFFAFPGTRFMIQHGDGATR